jgi:DNA-binding MarR family transcriptional regulator
MNPAKSSRHIATRIESLAEFRYTLRKFLHFSEEAATQAGLTPQQHQLLLQIAGAPEGTTTTIGYVAERLALRHHSTVELSNRCVDAGLLIRRHDEHDGRVVILELTAAGSRVLHSLSEDHARELDELAPKLIQSLKSFRRNGPKERQP